MSDQEFFAAWDATDSLEAGRGKVNTALATARERTAVFLDSATTTALTLDGSQDDVYCDCGAAGITVTLPDDPDTDEPGAEYAVICVNSSNSVTVDRNGSPINGAASDDTISTAHERRVYRWSGDAAYGWHRITESA